MTKTAFKLIISASCLIRKGLDKCLARPIERYFNIKGVMYL